MIDADYRGQVKVLLFNHADTDFEGGFLRIELEHRGSRIEKSESGI